MEDTEDRTAVVAIMVLGMERPQAGAMELEGELEGMQAQEAVMVLLDKVTQDMPSLVSRTEAIEDHLLGLIRSELP